LQDFSNLALPVSSGTVAGSLKKLAQLFEPIKEVPQPKADDAFTS
jgi:hypothetical protein